ncbi:MAG: Uma2 family endonuclease [Desulfococcaceae bacterium]|jgi:Uma2 family endonuclease|nr:Uma2 family endonuclease [Desulfococcaceae bacterium]
MDSISQQLHRSPKLGLYYRDIRTILHEERKKRKQFYEDVREDQKAEFINGEVIVHSPVRIEHNITGKFLLKLMDTHAQIRGLGFVGYEKMMISLTRNDYEPDVCFWNKTKSKKFRPKQTQFPAPDFIAEVLSPSTEENDRTVKFEDYAAHGVKEYWIIDPVSRTVEQYLLKKDEYVLHIKADSGILKSKAVKGFAVPVAALFDEGENLAALRSVLQEV